MDDQSRKAPRGAIEVNDLPPKEPENRFDEKVKGGAEPVNGLKSPKPAEPISGGR